MKIVNRKNVLLVEDEKNVSETVKEMLVCNDYNVLDVARNTQEFKDLIKLHGKGLI